MGSSSRRNSNFEGASVIARRILPNVATESLGVAIGFRTDSTARVAASHAADAFRYLAMAWREMKAEAPPPPKKDALIYEVDAAGQLRPNMTVREIIELKRRKKRAANE